jgi:hypothetical protein
MSKAKQTGFETPVKTFSPDQTAFRLFTRLAADLSMSLPEGCADYLIGRARGRDYAFFCQELPKAALLLASGDNATHECPLWGRFVFQSNEHIEALYLLSNYLKKYPFSGSEVFNEEYRLAAATKSFWKAERFVRRCNKLAKHHREAPLIVRARAIIAEILPRYSWEEATKRAYFGPGVNCGVSWNETDTAVKLYLDKTVTPLLRRQLQHAASFVPGYLYFEGLRVFRDENLDTMVRLGGWQPPHKSAISFLTALGLCRLQNTAKTVSGGKFSTAPKDALTFRGIDIQPAMNSFLQNGQGVWMSEILASYSQQLNSRDQKRNRVLAYAGSASGMLATIDLSSASDTIGCELVKSLLPADWYAGLRLTRAPTTFIGGKNHKLAKFSSMGNGYTFPLETLVFYAISRAAIEVDAYKNTYEVAIPKVDYSATADTQPNLGGPGANREPSVYGDDIICVAKDAPLVLKALRDCGFWPNKKKSFYTGPFRESCGHDYRYGQYIRPVFLRRPIEWSFELYNQINQVVNPFGLGWFTERYNRPLTSFFAELITMSHRFPPSNVGPIGMDHTTTYIRVPDVILSRMDGATALVNSNEALPPWRKDPFPSTLYFWPLQIKTRKFQSMEDIGTYLKSLIDNQSINLGSLYSRVVRGEVTVSRPKKAQDGSPILGEDDQTVLVLALRYLTEYRRLRTWKVRN